MSHSEQIDGLPDDLARVLRDPSIIVPKDAAVFEAIGRYAESKLRELRHYPDLKMAEVNVRACAYNAAVSYGSERARKKMWDLIRAINEHERLSNKAKLDELVRRGIIDGYHECPASCCMRPGGLFHVKGCPNDFNSAARIRSRADPRNGGAPMPDRSPAWAQRQRRTLSAASCHAK